MYANRATPKLKSLTGHATSVESVTLDWPEEIAIAGSASGAIKLWDLQHSKDAVVKIWDVRKKGCIQTYTGHGAAVEVLRITPDGRWIATGGADGMVKIWDMTAGKALRTYEEPGARVLSLAFNPAEFMLATALSDRRLRFYDLQTFETISTTPQLDLAPTCIDFHHGGQHLLVAAKESLEVWSWEPARSHEMVRKSWRNVVDIKAMDDGRLVAASIDQNMVTVWAVNTSRKMDLHPAFTQKSQPASSRSKTPSTAPNELRTPPSRRERSRSTRKSDEAPDVAPARLIPSSGTGDGPLNLDLSKFVASSDSKRSNGAPPVPSPLSPADLEPAPTTEDDVVDAVGFRHVSMVSILTARLAALRAIKYGWDEGGGGNVKAAFEALSACKDTAVWVDFLRVLETKQRLLTLEIAAMMLPMLNELLFEVFEDYIVTACRMIRILSKSFGQIIMSSVFASAHYSSPGVDFAREERVERCRTCYKKFAEISGALGDLKKTPGLVGISVRETLSELSIFTS
ncbi:Katanin p80 WD40 repeat-containing subunit B1 [Irineochytrium annulatum]|nr:Katanin p80 WD40 repeat-containing subunit B1 [Irineochytrium annulatum]